MEEKEIDKRVQTLWNKSDLSFENHSLYVKTKKYKYELTFIDLLYVSNFKGGNSTINEKEDVVNGKLEQYSLIFQKIGKTFENTRLKDLSEEQIQVLYGHLNEVSALTNKNSDSKIDGFSISYLSALLNVYFPDLLPILDRRILINLKIINSDPAKKQVEKSGQVKSIEEYYFSLIKKMREISQKENKTLREIDKELFPIKIPKY